MLTTGGAVLIVTLPGAGQEVDLAARHARLAERGASIEEVPASRSGEPADASGGEGPSSAVTTRVSLPEVLDRLGSREINELWVEAGPRLAGALLDQGLADELILYVAPKLLGPQARPLVETDELRTLDAAPNFTVVETRQIGEDVRLRLRPQCRQQTAVTGRGG
jgi:riboflavin biosynthesis pyrimidine reductase